MDLAVRLLATSVNVEVSRVFHDTVPPDKLRDCIAVIVADSHITEQSLSEATKLKLVQKFGVGVNTIDVEACTRRNVYVCNLPGLNAIDVAEYVVGAMVSGLRGFLRMDSATRQAAWEQRPALVGERLAGKKIGVVGLGQIGREVVRLLQPFHVTITAYDPHIDRAQAESLGVALVDLADVLSDSDIVTIHAPLTEETVGLIGQEELDAMKPNAMLINSARGPIVDEQALYHALRDGKLGFAILDVWTEEPLQRGNPLFAVENTQLSIHTASWTHQFFEDAMRLCCENVIRVTEGTSPRNVVNHPASPPSSVTNT
jgi:D-3-phosphoglycerate dehydrogenase